MKSVENGKLRWGKKEVKKSFFFLSATSENKSERKHKTKQWDRTDKMAAAGHLVSSDEFISQLNTSFRKSFFGG